MSTINLRQQIENYNDLDHIRIVVVENRNGSIKASNEEITTVGVLKTERDFILAICLNVWRLSLKLVANTQA